LRKDAVDGSPQLLGQGLHMGFLYLSVVHAGDAVVSAGYNLNKVCLANCR